MKYLGFILGVAGIYLFIFHHPAADTEAAPLPDAVAVVQPATPVPASALKRPLNRSNEALSQLPMRNGAGDF